jgi:Uma2 family endonuclease
MTLADLLKRLGGIAPERVRLRLALGTATEKDLLDIHHREGRLYELVDGVLVEKPLGYPEGSLATWMAMLLESTCNVSKLGCVAGADGAVRLMPGLVRIPDLPFIPWDSLPGRCIPDKPILGLAPDLAAEVLSRRNTAGEMALKVREYLLSGVRLVWLVDPRKRVVRVYTAPDRSVELTESDTLDGGEVLPGLELPIRRIFERLPKRDRKRRPKAWGCRLWSLAATFPLTVQRAAR